MNIVLRAMSWMDDRLNPIVVKELRQAVQGRFLSWVLLGFLLVQMVVLGASLLSVDAASASWLSSRAGSNYFSYLQAILLGTCMLFVPMYTGARMSLERANQNGDLLYISTLSPRAIIGGKFQSAVLLTVLIFSACAPFMLVSYLLRGIDIISIFTSLGISFLGILGGIQLAIFGACLPVGRFFKIILGLILLAALGFWLIFVVAITTQIVNRGIISLIGVRQFGWIFSLFSLGYLSIIAILFSLSVALVSPSSSNRVLPVRIVLSVVWLTSAVLALILSHYEKNYQPLFGWFILVSLTLGTILFFTVNERETNTHRVTKTIPKNPFLRMLVFPFYTGVFSGLAWVLLCAIGSLSVLGIAYYLNTMSSVSWRANYFVRNEWFVPAGIFLFTFCYATAGFFIRRRWFHKISSGFTWSFALLVFAICAILPMLFTFFFGVWRTVQEGSLIVTPFVLGARKYKHAGITVACIWSVLMLLLLLPMLIQSFRSFRSEPIESEGNDEPIVSTVSL